jgi:adenylate cyclase
MERRLAAILVADVVGYSRLVEADEEATIKGFRAHREAIFALVTSHHGRVFGGAGDSVVAEFVSPVEAVRCAVAIQRDVNDRNADMPEHRRMLFRIGVNLGDVIIDDDNLLGDGVNVAARLESLAGPAEVFISRPVFDQVRKLLPFGYEDLGEQQVKNLAEPVAVYRVSPEISSPKGRSIKPKPIVNLWRLGVFAVAILIFLVGAGYWWMTSGVAVSDRGKFRLPDRPSIAVLSLNTFSNEEEQRFLADGIAEDIITQLARNSELTVMARTATLAFKDKGLSAMEIASKLDVHYILEGSVRRVGEQLRITAQLIDAKSGYHVWAEQYDSAAASIFKTQDDIVEKIVGTLFSEIRETEKAEILRRPPSTLDVYELTLRGLARKHRLNPEDSRLARKDLLRAVELDPNYAPAWLYLGWVEGIAMAFKWIDGLDLSNIKDAIGKVERAIELDPMLATAYQALGILRSWDGDADGALLAARRSVELGPGDADNLLFLGRALASVGEFDQAVADARHAVALNPSRPSYYDAALGRALWGQGTYDETITYMNDCLSKTPGYTACRIFQVASYYGLGNSAAASKAVTALLQRSPNLTVSDALKGMGFPGDANANERLAKQLTEAGLPINKGASATK